MVETIEYDMEDQVMGCCNFKQGSSGGPSEKVLSERKL